MADDIIDKPDLPEDGELGDPIPDEDTNTEDLTADYLAWIEDYCRNNFDPDNLPGGVKLALNNLVKTDPLSFNVTSEKIADLSQTFANSGGVPAFILEWLSPYRRLKSL